MNIGKTAPRLRNPIQMKNIHFSPKGLLVGKTLFLAPLKSVSRIFDISGLVLGQLPPGQLPPRTITPGQLPPGQLPPDNYPPDNYPPRTNTPRTITPPQITEFPKHKSTKFTSHKVYKSQSLQVTKFTSHKVYKSQSLQVTKFTFISFRWATAFEIICCGVSSVFLARFFIACRTLIDSTSPLLAGCVCSLTFFTIWSFRT